MKKQLVRSLVLIMCGAFLFSCAAGPQTPMTFQSSQFPADQYGPKVDNFMVVFDSSSSMGFKYNGQEKLAIAKNVVSSLNQTIPELNYNAAMRTFGHCSSVTGDRTLLVYGLEKYSNEGLASAISGVNCAGGNTPLGAAIAGAHADFKDAMGKTALIVVSDGKDLLDSPLAAAEAMAADFGDKLCIYTIQIGDDPKGAAALESLAKITGCGSSTTADALTSAQAMGSFVEAALLTQALDSDGDGVLDPYDKCPGTPRGIKVDEHGCPLDLDGDGVADYMDKCPGTPAGAKTNAEGCWIVGRIHFDLDSATIRSEDYAVLNEVAGVMKNNPNLRMRIDGFTCNLGGQAYNQRLSERRAQAAKTYLMNKGIDSGLLREVGHWFKTPIASNETEEGRSMNRRAEFTPFQ